MEYLTLKEIQNVELKLLIKITDFCDSHNLVYTLDSGTLLGAIRHKGFIPWDDDIDILIPRPDYEKLLSLLKKQNDIKYCIYSEGNSIYPYLKILDKTVKIEHDSWSIKYSFDDSDYLWVDVFPMDGTPNNKKSIKDLYRKKFFVKKCYSCSILKYRENINFMKSIIEKIIFPVFRKIGPLRLAGKLDKVSKSYDYNKCGDAADIVWGYTPQEIMKKKKYLDRVKVTFEGYKFWAPGCWREYLTGLYGDYMKLPPKSKRQTHHVRAFKIK